MKFLPLFLGLLIIILCCTNDNVQTLESEYSSVQAKDSIVLNKELLKNKIRVWGDSTVLLIFKKGGLGFIKFKNDSLYDDGFSSDSLLKTYHLSDSAGTLVIKFIEPRSAITGVPNIFALHIYKYEFGSFYGSVENISPNLSNEKKFTDTMQMMSWERWRKEEKLIK
ncbi:hypothetical protein [Brumimicrobium mesophilum]|uniref:hypothetical protein n=1 Tax=Brumimicrobium mesophilum TaxID=392717 RepID=UPI000D141E44|nr:hypothetical protein [Brumimicrobium mesophilum]